MAATAKLKALRRVIAPGVAACVLVAVATAAAQSEPADTPVAEAAAVADSTAVAAGEVVTISEGIGVADATSSVAGAQVAVGEGVAVADSHGAVSGERVAIGEGVAVGDGTGTVTGQVVDVTEGVEVDDGTTTEKLNAPPQVVVPALAGIEGAAANGTGSFTDPDSTSWTATVEYGDGTPVEPLPLQPDGSFLLSHVYDDDGAYVATVTITDADGDSGTATAAVTIDNVPPEAVLADATGAEGAPITLAFADQSDPSQADTEAGFTYRYACDGATLGPETSDAATTCAFDDDGTYPVLARIADKDGGSTDYTAVVTVENVRPDGTLGNDGPVAEGSAVTISWSGQADPSTADTAAGFTYRYACDGATLGPETLDASATCSLDDGPGTHTVLARIADDDGGFTDRTTEVVVENAAPDGALGNDGPVAEGSTATVSWSGQADPSAADAAAGFTYRYACDGATLGPETTEPTATCAFDDGPAGHTVLALITDKDGGSTARTTVVTVENVAPTATLANDGPVVEGSPATISFSGQSDASQADRDTGFLYRYACDGVTLGAPTAAPSASCTFDDEGVFTVLARIIDKDGGHTDYTTEVAVTNAAPTGTLVAPTEPVDEGATFTLAVTDVSDPSDGDTAAGFTIEFDCGTGAGFGPGGTCVAVDDPAQEVQARIVDEDGGETVLQATVTVANVAPSAQITAPPAGSFYRVGETVTFAGTFADPGVQDTHTAVWSFDGSTEPGTVTESGGSGSASLTRSFAAAGVYSVQLTIDDGDGGSTTASTVDGVPALVVVYDPSAGFVKGGGSFTSPPGAYTADPASTGPATFTIAARYKPGATAPSGSADLRFAAAGFTFNSTSCDWLVVAGEKAQLQGRGTVNGVGGHRFLLTAYDGPDRIRLKVWDAAGHVVYDNAPGSSDDIDLADPQAIGSGAVVIHR